MLLSMARCSRVDPCSPLPAAEADGSIPQTFTSVEGRFKIDLPPTKSETEVDESKGYNDTSFKWFIVNRGRFEVSYFDSPNVLEKPENSELLINKFREVRLKSGQVEVDTERRLAGHPGHELRIREKHSLQIERIYIVNKRLYMVHAFVPDEMNCGLDEVIKTLDSFALIEESGVASTLVPK